MTVVNDKDLNADKYKENGLKLNKSNKNDKICNVLIEIKVNTTNNNTNSTNNQTDIIITNTTKLYFVSDPDNKDIILLSDYMNKLTVDERNEICNKCLDNVDPLQELKEKIRLVTEDIKRFNNMTTTKQDIIVKFSHQINNVNLIKVSVLDYINIIELLKNSKCSNYEKNNELYQFAMKNSGSLVESIQNYIRKSNLNVNFLIIS